MAIFGKDRERGDRTPSGHFDAPPSSGGISFGEGNMLEREKVRTTSDDGSATSAFLGKGSRVNGKVSFEGPARIEGTVEGEIVAQDTLTIGESAVVNAQITGGTVVIHGRVTGDVTARKRLEVRAPGRLSGNISTPSLVIHEGVVFEGQCSMGNEPRASEKDRRVALAFSKDERDTAAPPLAAAESK
jgi:cytoskeletal protein CcmA (bactofilin family)